MNDNPTNAATLSSRLRGAACALLLLAACPFVPAAGLTVLMGDELPAHMEFVRQLRAGQEPGSRFDVLNLQAPGGIGQAAAGTSDTAPKASEERMTTSARTRRPRLAAEPSLTLAVGIVAARAALERPGPQPLLLAMLSRLDYESLEANPALRRGDRRVGVLLRDPSMVDLLALVAAVLPQKRRLGVVAASDSEPLLRELQRAAQNASPPWALQLSHAPDPRSLATALRSLLPRSDALMVLPDSIGDSQAAALSVLRAGAEAGLPVFGASEGLVRSGGLAAAVSTPSQLARQAYLLGQKLTSGFGDRSNSPLVEAATPATVRVNTTVARGLDLRLPEAQVLTERLAIAR